MLLTTTEFTSDFWINLKKKNLFSCAIAVVKPAKLLIILHIYHMLMLPVKNGSLGMFLRIGIFLQIYHLHSPGYLLDECVPFTVIELYSSDLESSSFLAIKQ